MPAIVYLNGQFMPLEAACVPVLDRGFLFGDGVSEVLLRQVNEVWLTRFTREILPVTGIDGRPVGDARPGPLWWRMYAAYQSFKQKVREGKA